MEQIVTSTVTMRKRKISMDQRMLAKALLLEHFPEVQAGGQLIIHFTPGKNPQYIEWQERADHVQSRLQQVS